MPENLADDFFRFGTVEFTTGDAGGTWPFEVVAFDGYTAGGRGPQPHAGIRPVGDAVLLRDGCSRVKKADDPTGPDVPDAQQRPALPRPRPDARALTAFIRFPIPGTGETRAVITREDILAEARSWIGTPVDPPGPAQGRGRRLQGAGGRRRARAGHARGPEPRGAGDQLSGASRAASCWPGCATP
jgi:hypothetical protein